jgi:hypothetical protein
MRVDDPRLVGGDVVETVQVILDLVRHGGISFAASRRDDRKDRVRPVWNAADYVIDGMTDTAFEAPADTLFRRATSASLDGPPREPVCRPDQASVALSVPGKCA